MAHQYGEPPVRLANLRQMKLTEQMHYLYLPIVMGWNYEDVRLPYNLKSVRPMFDAVKARYLQYRYCYLSAVRGIASPGNALNRPGWHADGFGTSDFNVVWWKGPGTQFAVQGFNGIGTDDQASLVQFDVQVLPERVITPSEGYAYELSPFCVHAVPNITKVCERQFVKLSFSNDAYNLEGNSHNYLFRYEWDMVDRAEARNVTNKDFVKP